MREPSSYHDNWGRGRELFDKAVRGARRAFGWIKQWWLYRLERRVAENALERYYLTEYKNMSANIRKDRISRDIIKMQSGY